MNTVPEPQLWTAYGILYLSQVLTETGPKTFQTLKEEFSLPNHLLLWYLQLRHTVRAQFANITVTLDTPPVLDILFGPDLTKLISNLYYTIRLYRVHKVSQTAKIAWEQDIGPIDNSDWDEILEGVKTASPKLSDRLTQLYIVHRAYLTPLKLAKFHPTRSNLCPMCLLTPRTFYHLLWSCPHIQTWVQVIQFLHDHMGTPVGMDPKLCLLGLLPDIDVDKYQAIFIYETLFLARKVIAKVWMQALPPTLQGWKREINTTLPYRKMIHMHRGHPQKFASVWDRWLEDGETCTQ